MLGKTITAASAKTSQRLTRRAERGGDSASQAAIAMAKASEM